MRAVWIALLVFIASMFIIAKSNDRAIYGKMTNDEKVKMICEVSNNPDVVDLCKQKRENLKMCEKEPVVSEGYERCVRTHEQLVGLILDF